MRRRSWLRLACMGPGVYTDGASYHILCDEFLAGSDLVITPSNRATVEAAIKAAILAQLPADVRAYLENNDEGAGVHLQSRYCPSRPRKRRIPK